MCRDEYPARGAGQCKPAPLKHMRPSADGRAGSPWLGAFDHLASVAHQTSELLTEINPGNGIFRAGNACLDPCAGSLGVVIVRTMIASWDRREGADPLWMKLFE